MVGLPSLHVREPSRAQRGKLLLPPLRRMWKRPARQSRGLPVPRWGTYGSPISWCQFPMLPDKNGRIPNMVSFLLSIVQCHVVVDTSDKGLHVRCPRNPFLWSQGSPLSPSLPLPQEGWGPTVQDWCLGTVCKASLWSAPAYSTASLTSIFSSDVLLWNFSFW